MAFINNFKTALTSSISAEYGQTGEDDLPIPAAMKALLIEKLPNAFIVTLTLASDDPENPAFEIINYAPSLNIMMRGAEETTPAAWPAGTIVYMALTAEYLNNLDSVIMDVNDLGNDVTALTQRVGTLEGGSSGGGGQSVTVGTNTFPWTGSYDPEGYAAGDLYTVENSSDFFIATAGISSGNMKKAWLPIKNNSATDNDGVYLGSSDTTGRQRTFLIRSGATLSINATTTVGKALSSEAVTVSANYIQVAAVAYDRSILVYALPSEDANIDYALGIPDKIDVVVSATQLTPYPAL